MTNILFELQSLSLREAKALHSMLGTFINEGSGDSRIPSVQLTATDEHHVNAREKACPVVTLGEAMAPSMAASIDNEALVPIINEAAAEQLKPEEAHTPVEPMIPLKRPRRTKAEMEAAAAQENPTPSAPAVEAITTSAAVATDQAPTLDQLRDALNGYNDRHGLPAATALLGDFECKRLSEVQSRPVADQVEFLKLASNV